MTPPRCACGFQMPSPMHAYDCKLYDAVKIYGRMPQEGLPRAAHVQYAENVKSKIILLENELENLGYKFFGGEHWYDLNIIGLRSAENRPNVFDDTLICAFVASGTWRLEAWPVTTDPGRSSLLNPMRPEGCAILVPGQYRGAWRIGLHQGRADHPALVQAAPVKVWRDANRDSVANYGGPVQEGMFGINIHHAGPDSKTVDNWSAGCQVFKRQADHKEFMALCHQQVALNPSFDRFSYTLIDLAHAPALAPLAVPYP